MRLGGGLGLGLGLWGPGGWLSKALAGAGWVGVLGGAGCGAGAGGRWGLGSWGSGLWAWSWGGFETEIGLLENRDLVGLKRKLVY